MPKEVLKVIHEVIFKVIHVKHCDSSQKYRKIKKKTVERTDKVITGKVPMELPKIFPKKFSKKSPKIFLKKFNKGLP